MAPDEVRFRQIGKPLSCALLLWAMITAILGAIRFMRMQDALIHEEAVIEGGWELHAEGIGIFLVCHRPMKSWEDTLTIDPLSDSLFYDDRDAGRRILNARDQVRRIAWSCGGFEGMSAGRSNFVVWCFQTNHVPWCDHIMHERIELFVISGICVAL
jgi:hypothetical protein